MLDLQTKEYMNQMDLNIDDKMKVLQWIKGHKVLDAGCGGGELTARLNWDFGYDAYGIDLSLLAYKEMMNKNLKDKFIHGNLLDMSLYFEKEEFDTIIFSSVLHEVYSYNGFNLGDIEQTLKNSLKILPSGGRIIIRDGVKSSGDGFGFRLMKFKNKNDILFLTEYCRRFKGRHISYDVVKDYFAMKLDDVMEFLYTYTWGWDSFDREVQEQFGVLSLNEYEVLANRLGARVIHSEEYLQTGYNDHLLNKIELYDGKMNPVALPNSTMLMVIEKK